MTLGQKIQRLRKEKRLTQEQLAERLHVSRQAVSRWELDEVLPDTQNLLPLKGGPGSFLGHFAGPGPGAGAASGKLFTALCRAVEKIPVEMAVEPAGSSDGPLLSGSAYGVLVRYGALARRLRSAAAGLLGILSVGVSHRLGRLGLDAADPVSQTETGAAIKKLPREIPREFFYRSSVESSSHTRP